MYKDNRRNIVACAKILSLHHTYMYTLYIYVYMHVYIYIYIYICIYICTRKTEKITLSAQIHRLSF